MARQTISFTELPAEIRNRIYAYALVRDTPLKFQCYHSQVWVNLRGVIQPSLSGTSFEDLVKRLNLLLKERVVSQPALTCASKQIRGESLPVFYGANSFEYVLSQYSCSIDGAECGRLDWLVAIGTQNRLFMQELKVSPGWNQSHKGVMKKFEKRMGIAGTAVDIVREGWRCDFTFRAQFIKSDEREEED